MDSQTTERAQAEKPVPVSRSGGMGRQAKIILLAAGGVVALFLLFLLFYMGIYSNIYPGVSVGGIDLGGLSLEQAKEKTNAAAAEEYANKSLSVRVGDLMISFTAQEVGAYVDADSVAEAAHGFGRSGGFFQNMGEALSALFSAHDLDVEGVFYIDRKTIEDRIAGSAVHLNAPVVQSIYEVVGNTLLITKGATGQAVDQTALADEIEERFRSFNFTDIQYQPIQAPPGPLDWDAVVRTVFTEPRDAYLDTSDHKDAKIIPHVTGISFDLELAKNLYDAGAESAQISVPLVFSEPEITESKLSASLFKDQLSTFTTELSASNVPRTTNIRLTAGIINETVLAPGDVFSFNGFVGERTASRGFQSAGAYVGGKLVDEVGGGICQASTTLYNAVLRANLKIVERNNHGLTVLYVPLGLDAAVSWGTLDFKFENNREYPIKIQASQSGSKVTFTILGTKVDDVIVEMQAVTLSTNPFETKVTVNPNMAPGTSVVVNPGHTGAVAESYRILKHEDGTVISKNFEAKSVYARTDQIVERGPDAAETDPNATTDPDATTPGATTEPPATTEPTTQPTTEPTTEATTQFTTEPETLPEPSSDVWG